MLRRVVACTAGAAVLVTYTCGVAVAASGWTSVRCDVSPQPECNVAAGSRAHGPRRRSSARPRASSTGGRVWVAPSASSTPSRPADPDLTLARCAYKRSSYQAPAPVTATSFRDNFTRPKADPALWMSAGPALAPVAEKGSAGGAWYVYKCEADGVLDGVYRPPIWIPDTPAVPGPPGRPRLPAPVVLARVARGQLRLSAPVVHMSPAGRQIVQVPTWLWVDHAAWSAVSASASVPGESVTATATPVSAAWSLGDGHTVRCAGPGAVYSPGARAGGAASPDCGHIYRQVSAGRPGGAFAVRVVITWRVTWAGGGQRGVLGPLMTTARVSVPVVAAPAVNIR